MWPFIELVPKDHTDMRPVSLESVRSVGVPPWENFSEFVILKNFVEKNFNQKSLINSDSSFFILLWIIKFDSTHFNFFATFFS
jgi:hypothetical protein